MDKKQILSSATIAVFAGILLAWAPSTAYAGVNDNSAMITREVGCNVFIDPYVAFSADIEIIIENNSRAIKMCQFTNVENPPLQKAQTFEGFFCDVDGIETFDSFFVVTPEGNGVLKCKVDLKDI